MEIVEIPNLLPEGKKLYRLLTSKQVFWVVANTIEGISLVSATVAYGAFYSHGGGRVSGAYFRDKDHGSMTVVTAPIPKQEKVCVIGRPEDMTEKYLAEGLRIYCWYYDGELHMEPKIGGNNGL